MSPGWLYHHINVHVHTRDSEVIRAVRACLTTACFRDRGRRAERHRLYREVLHAHSDARDLYHHVIGGTL